MITRHFAETQIVTAFPYKCFVSCTVATTSPNMTSACGGTWSGALGYTWSGYIIDRLGLMREFNSVTIVPAITQDPNTSATSCNYMYGVSLGLQHASSTSGSWQDYSTGEWPAYQGLLAQTTTTATSTGVQNIDGWTREGLELGPIAYFLCSTVGNCATSTHFSAFVSSANNTINLNGCKRFIRLIIRPEIGVKVTTCSVLAGMETMASLVFGHPTESPSGTTSAVVRGRVIVTSGCTTASGPST
jgi:hypothetical protein